MEQITVKAEKGKKSLLTRLREAGAAMTAYCGGAGTCGKCGVRFVSVPTPVTEADRAFFSDAQLAEGWRLACRAFPEGEVTVAYEAADEEQIVAETGFFGAGHTAAQHDVSARDPETEARRGRAAGESSASEASGREMIAAVDIGTTTIAMAAVDPVTGEVAGTVAGVNHQRSFGADVVTRMDASNRGHGEELQKLVRDDLAALARSLGIGAEAQVIVSANTTMQHLLEGLSCETLGVAPYTPVDISLHDFRNQTMLPGISTYVGADIVSGVIATDMDLRDEICMLVDLGTNGEMVIGNRKRLLAASTAAGPAFEGGNIHCGTAGIPGAICGVYEIGRSETAHVVSPDAGSPISTPDGMLAVRTIGDALPVGICGTGVLEIVHALLGAELIDETGALDEDYADAGYPLADGIVFTAQDVREVQLAKSAIRAGIEALMQEYGIAPEAVGRVYLAGGFGEKIDVEKAIGIGLLPEAFAGRVVPVGNSSLAGAILYARDPDGIGARLMRVAGEAQEVALAERAAFTELYMEHMFFPE